MTIDPTVVVAAIGTLSSGIAWLVRTVYLDLKRDRDYWRSLALELLAVNKGAIEVAKVKSSDG